MKTGSSLLALNPESVSDSGFFYLLVCPGVSLANPPRLEVRQPADAAMWLTKPYQIYEKSDNCIQ